MLRDRFKSELQKAMKSREALKVSTLRLILAAIKDRDLDSRSKGNGDTIADSNILEILSKMVKQRKETISTYRKAGRNDLADQEDNEITIISEFLPKQLSEKEISQEIEIIIKTNKANDMKDMGRIMGIASKKFAGKADNSLIAKIVKSKLL